MARFTIKAERVVFKGKKVVFQLIWHLTVVGVTWIYSIMDCALYTWRELDSWRDRGQLADLHCGNGFIGVLTATNSVVERCEMYCLQLQSALCFNYNQCDHFIAIANCKQNNKDEVKLQWKLEWNASLSGVKKCIRQGIYILSNIFRVQKSFFQL